MPYTHTTLSRLRGHVASILGDVEMVRFTPTEIDEALREALATLHCAALNSRARVTLQLTSGQAFYSLPGELPAALGMTLTDRELINLLCRALQEPQLTVWDGTWPGSEQFTLAEITATVQYRRDNFLLQTGMLLTERNPYPAGPAVLPAGAPRVTLPDTVLDVRRAAWVTLGGDVHPLSLEDAEVVRSFYADAPDEGRPECYTLTTEPQLTLALAPTPADGGRLHLLASESGAALDTQAGVGLELPQPFYWALKYGALADLLGPHTSASDPTRARYCERRFREGVELARLYPAVLYAEIQGRGVATCALADLDQFSPNWQNTSGRPDVLALPAWNMLAVAPVPDGAEVYTLTLDLVVNPTLPTADADAVEIDRAHLDTVLEYARHVCLFKEGGEEFLLSMPAYDRMVRLASQQNHRLLQQARSFLALSSRAQQDEQRRPSGLRDRSRYQQQQEQQEDEELQQQLQQGGN